MAGSDDEPAHTATLHQRASPAASLEDRFGRYRLEHALGAGGMGVVHAAFDPDLERRVALKVLRREHYDDVASERLRREAKAMAKLSHPNVVTVHEVSAIDGRDYIAMELVEGGTLADWLRSEPRRPRDIVAAFVAAGRGLAAAHAAGIVHRDFKPHNVLRARDGRVAVTDFGLARHVELPVDPAAETVKLAKASPAPASSLTSTGSVLGTPSYMAPEQWSGAAVGPAADQFAFCVALWEALTGERPFRGANLDELRAQIERGPAAIAASKLPRRLRAPLRRGLDPDPRARWPSMEALLDRLERATSRRTIVFVVAGAIAIAAGVAFALWRAPAATWHADARPIEPTYDENSEGAAVSPDGTLMAFGAIRGLDAPLMTYVQPLAGGPAREINANSCGWSARWTADGNAVIATCGGPRGRDRRVIRQPLDGGPPTELGRGSLATPCGDRLLVTVTDATKSFVVERSADGRDRTVVEDAILARCDPSGRQLAFTRDRRDQGYLGWDLWLYDERESRMLVRGGVQDVAFTPDARSIVIARLVDGHYDLYEYVLADASIHRVTFDANARSVDITRDGSTVVFDDDVTTIALFEHAAGSKTQRTFPVEWLANPDVAPAGDRVVIERLGETTAVIAVTLRDGAEHELGRGKAPFVSRDGRRVFYVDADDPARLLSVPIDGGTATLVARLPAPIVEGTDADDGIHLEVGTASATHAWRVDPDGTLRDEGVDGLVFPARSGWRIVRHRIAGTHHTLRVIAPGKPLDVVELERDAYGRPAWIGDHELAYCEAKNLVRLDVATRENLESTPISIDSRSSCVVAQDGKRAFSTQAVGHVTRRKIVNFADRPWRP
jgi:tRNA A-37 threonylcarbamoyl transferase component Bud32